MEHIVFELDYKSTDLMPVEKEAKIFEAGHYPDKGIDVTEDDLDVIIDNFMETPIKVEHTDTRLDPLGVVKQIWRKGKDLFAKLAFPREVAEFLERRGVKKLSVALIKDPLRIAEVSLVLNPRIPTAAIFRSEQKLHLTCDGIDNVPIRHESACKCEVADSQEQRIFDGKEVQCSMGQVSMTEVDKDREIAQLKLALRCKDVDAKLAELKAAGKLVPASEELARSILLNADQLITFSDVEMPVATLFMRFLEAQPKVIEFQEMATSAENSEVSLSREEEELIAKLGLSKDKLQKYKA